MRLDHPRCSFASSLDTFLSTGKEEWLARMEARESGRPLHQEQIAAWADCYDVLLHTLPAIQAQHPELIIIFEYELPYEAGRRPDVILLSKEQVVILEFKMKCRVLRADVDQVAAYARDLQEYHFESRNRKVTPLLVVTRMKHTLESRGSVLVTSGDCLQEALLDTLREDTTACDAAAWMSSRYEPLPTIVETAQRIMRKEALPHIRSADSAGIPQALQCLTGIATYAHKKGKHLAQDASTFINHLISGEINQAKSLVPSLKSAGYTMLVTQDLDAAKAYCTTRYKGQTSKRYGLLVSSKAETALMRRYGVDNSYEATSMRNMDIAAWYNDPPESPKSCCSFRQVVTEFSCQGLEVDLPILCWGPDMIWNGNAWNLYRPMQSADSNDNRYRVNSYRVLLTRGRDGLLVFVPPESKLFPIYDLLRRVGLEEL